MTWYAELKNLLNPASILKRDEPLHKHTTMRIGGPAQLWFEPTDEHDLTVGLKFAHERAIPVTFIGRGSNLLIRDGGILGLCIHLGRPYFSRIEIEGEYVTVGAGARLKQIVAEGRKFNLGGFEFMEGIPGNMGGALRMNAGAMQGWTMEVVESVRSIDLLGHVHEVNKADTSESLSVYDVMAEKAGAKARLGALVEASDRLTKDFGSWGVPWGEINRFQRVNGDIVQPFDDAKPSISVPFVSSRWGSLASFGAHRWPGTKRYYGTSGNSFVAVVEFGPKVHARAITAGGESGHPDSPHFNDEAERYTTGNLRTVYFWPEQLDGHTERVYHPGE